MAAFTLNATIAPAVIEDNINRAVVVVTNAIIKAADIAIPKFSKPL